MDELITSYGGWNYYTNGVAVSPDGSYYQAGEKIWSPSPVAAYSPSPLPASGSDSAWVQNLGGLFGYAGKTYTDTWAAKTMMQTAQNGQRYVEGQRIQAMQQSGSPLLLLLLAGAAFLALR